METVTQETRTERDAHCDALQALVDLLRANPEAATPFNGPVGLVTGIYEDSLDHKATLAAWARAASHLRPEKSGGDQFFTLNVDFGGGVVVQLISRREEVCERIVTGTKTVTKTVKDPEALKRVPEVEVTEEVEEVEWRCGSLLAAADGSSWAS